MDPALTFTRPNQVRLRQVEYHSGLLPSRRRSGQRVIEEAFIVGTEPVLSFDPGTRAVYDLPWYQQRALYGEPKAGENMPEDLFDWTPIMRGWQKGDRAEGP